MKGTEKKTNNMLCSLIKVCVVSWELRWKGTKLNQLGVGELEVGGGGQGGSGRGRRVQSSEHQTECGWARVDFSSRKPWLRGNSRQWKQYLQMLKCLRRHCCGEITDITQCVQPACRLWIPKDLACHWVVKALALGSALSSHLTQQRGSCMILGKWLSQGFRFIL